MPGEAPPPSGLCRDCLTRFSGAASRCPECRSPRVIAHPELETLGVAHVDCDAFYASVEKRDDPGLADKPLIIGGGVRGVVSTACYIARLSGVRSAMPMFKAKRLCPDAVVLPPSGKKYAAVSREIRALMDELTPLVEPLSLDEAFLDLRGGERLHGEPPARTLARLMQRIEAEVGVSASVGLSDCKFLAKIASDLDKPRGFSVIGRGEALDFLAPRPVGTIWGVGKALTERLKRDGVETIADLRGVAPETLMARYGAMGKRLHDLSRAMDSRPVRADSPMKSISAETTFNEDIPDAEALHPPLWRLCEKVARRSKAKGLGGRTVTLKLKTADFRLSTRRATLETPINYADSIYRTATKLLAKEALPGRIRLVGVGISALEALGADNVGYDADLFDPGAPTRLQAERAVDALRSRFGEDAIDKGRAWRPKTRK